MVAYEFVLGSNDWLEFYKKCVFLILSKYIIHLFLDLSCNMAEPAKLNLRRKHFVEILGEMFGYLDNQNLTDVTLICSGKLNYTFYLRQPNAIFKVYHRPYPCIEATLEIIFFFDKWSFNISAQPATWLWPNSLRSYMISNFINLVFP